MEATRDAKVRRAMLVLLVAAAVACSWLGPMDAMADRQIDAGLKRALASFAAARALNAFISLAQGTAVSVQPGGVGVNFAVGQVLEPVNDLVRHFSNLMLAASVAFGVQKVLVTIGAHWLVSLMLTAASAAWAVLLLRRQRLPRWLVRMLVVTLLLRFAMPVVTLGSDAVFQQFLAADYLVSQQVIETTATHLERMNAAPPAGADNQGVLDKFRAWIAAKATDWKDRFDGLKQAVEKATMHIVKLIVSFLLQTLVLPLGLLWLLIALARGALYRSSRQQAVSQASP